MIWNVYPRCGFFFIPDMGSRIQGSKKHRIPDPQHWIQNTVFPCLGSGSGHAGGPAPGRHLRGPRLLRGQGRDSEHCVLCLGSGRGHAGGPAPGCHLRGPRLLCRQGKESLFPPFSDFLFRTWIIFTVSWFFWPFLGLLSVVHLCNVILRFSL